MFFLFPWLLALLAAALGGLLTPNRGYWLGVSLPPSLFMLLCAAQHLRGLVAKGNVAPDNRLALTPDLLIPATLLGLLAARHAAEGHLEPGKPQA